MQMICTHRRFLNKDSGSCESILKFPKSLQIATAFYRLYLD